MLLFVAIAAAPMEARGRKTTAKEPGTYKEWGPDIDRIEIVKPFRFADYRKVQVEAFDTDGVELPDEDDNSYQSAKRALDDATEDFADGLDEELEKDVSLLRGTAEDGTQGTLLIRGKVTLMDPGSRAARYWAGFGAGAARSEIEAEIVDAQSGEVLLRFTQERRSGVGAFGGDYEDLMQRNLVAIGRDAAKILREF
jgi:hypothetical protein